MELNSELDRLEKIIEPLKPIFKALEDAHMKHPNWPENINKQTLIIIEEAGEVAKAVLKYQDEGGTLEDVKAELHETAAMCLRMLNDINGNIYFNKMMRTCIKCEHRTFTNSRTHYCTNPRSLNHQKELLKPSEQTCDDWKLGIKK